MNEKFDDTYVFMSGYDNICKICPIFTCFYIKEVCRIFVLRTDGLAASCCILLST